MNSRSFGCIVYELFHLEKLFYQRSPFKLQNQILQFDVEKQLKTDKIPQIYVRVLKESLLKIPDDRLTAKELNDIINVNNFY